MNRTILLFLLFLITACGGEVVQNIAPTDEQIKKADYGKYPSNYKDIIKRQYFNKNLYDPQSAIYSWKTPEKTWTDAPYGNGLSYGYIVTVCVNAKNRLGGYAGTSAYRFFLRNDKIVKSLLNDYDSELVRENFVRLFCSE